MFRYLIVFLLSLIAPNWMQDRTPDANHFYRRRFTSDYKAKRSKAKWLWIAVLSLMLLFPYPPAIVTLILFTTFITFSLMDESN